MVDSTWRNTQGNPGLPWVITIFCNSGFHHRWRRHHSLPSLLYPFYLVCVTIAKLWCGNQCNNTGTYWNIYDGTLCINTYHKIFKKKIAQWLQYIQYSKEQLSNTMQYSTVPVQYKIGKLCLGPNHKCNTYYFETKCDNTNDMDNDTAMTIK